MCVHLEQLRPTCLSAITFYIAPILIKGATHKT